MSRFLRTTPRRGGVRFQVRRPSQPQEAREEEDLDAPQPKPTKLELLIAALDREYGHYDLTEQPPQPDEA